MINLKTVFVGFCMGSVDVIPGVSGGTMALVLGIYERLITAIHSVLQLQTIQELTRGKLTSMWRRIDGSFLLSVCIGIIAGIVTVAKILEHTLTVYPEQMWALFFGAVLASAWLVAASIRQWSLLKYSGCALATLVAWFLVTLNTMQTPDTWWMLLLTGAVASCAMILPGISGAFLLVILGKYEAIVNAVNTLDVTTIALVGIGALIGIACFAWLLKLLLRRVHDELFAVLTGLLLGSVWRLWPWKLDPLEVQSPSILPAMNTVTAITILCIVLGAAGVWLLHRISTPDS